MNVAFIANYEKTIYFHAVATELEAAGHHVMWISPGAHWALWLTRHGVSPLALLDISRFGDSWKKTEATWDDRCELTVLEEASGLRVNDLILMDRILRDRPHSQVLRYLAVAARAIDNFITSREIQVIFSEQTFGIELITGMICKRAKRDLLVPHVVRIPTGRMGFFRGHLQEELVNFREVTTEHRQAAGRFLETFRRDRPRPDYFVRQNKAPVPKANWPAKLVKHVKLSVNDPFDLTHLSPQWLVRKRTSEVANAFYRRLNRSFWVPPQPPPRPFVLFPLHRQPESSIDVLGARVSNQLEVVRALSRTLPATHDLYVKEHPNGLGDRGPGFFRELRSIPGVQLVHPRVSTFALADTAALTLTISGTAAYEAALLRRPAATMAPMFFGVILLKNAFNPYADSLGELLDDREVHGDDDLVEHLSNVLAQSYEGMIDNPLFTPAVMRHENLEKVSQGFLDLLIEPRFRKTDGN